MQDEPDTRLLTGGVCANLAHAGQESCPVRAAAETAIAIVLVDFGEPRHRAHALSCDHYHVHKSAKILNRSPEMPETPQTLKYGSLFPYGSAFESKEIIMNTCGMTRRNLVCMAPLLAGFAVPGLLTRPAAAEDFNEKNTTYIVFEMGITVETMTALQDTVIDAVRHGSKNIVLMINSFGGDISAAIATHHFLLAMPVKLTTYNMSDVTSAAILLFLSGSNRVANQDSRFGFHSSSAEIRGGHLSTFEIIQMASEGTISNTRMRKIYKSRMNVDDAYCDSIMKKDVTYVGSDEAMKIGLIGSIDELHIEEKYKIVTVPQAPALKPKVATASAEE